VKKLAVYVALTLLLVTLAALVATQVSKPQRAWEIPAAETYYE
jgi:hypothetical protein